MDDVDLKFLLELADVFIKYDRDLTFDLVDYEVSAKDHVEDLLEMHVHSHKKPMLTLVKN